jgi:phosphoribosyl-ATP pyrophosphohydrolase
VAEPLDAALAALSRTIAERARSSPEQSYTARLVSKGIRHVAKKFGEEAIEATIAAVAGDRKNLLEESADVLYHFLVMLHLAGVSLDEVAEALSRRQGRSGLEEKASRPKDRADP